MTYNRHSRLRQALFIPAIVARRYNPLIRTFCKRLLAKGKSKQSVIDVAMHKLFRQVFGVLKSQKIFDLIFFLPPLDFQDSIYFSSCILLTIFVTSFLGINRTHFDIILFMKPGITIVFPRIRPSYPI